MVTHEISQPDAENQSPPAITPTDRLDVPETYVHVVSNPDEPVTNEQALSIAVERWRTQREAILALTTQVEGLDMQRVDGFCESQGMTPKIVCILAPDEFDRALAIAEAAPGSEDGKYLPRLDIIVVRRDPVEEELNGTGYTESVVVHERAHADAEIVSVGLEVRPTPSIIRSKIPAAVIPNDERSGFAVHAASGKAYGSFLEEGIPELVRAKYVVDVLGKPHGFVGDHEQGVSRLIANKYLFLDKTLSGEVIVDAYEGALPAMTLERLVQYDPKLWESLWSARRSGDGLRAAAIDLNQVQPGLYDKMRRINVETAEGQVQAAQLYESMVTAQLRVREINEASPEARAAA